MALSLLLGACGEDAAGPELPTPDAALPSATPEEASSTTGNAARVVAFESIGAAGKCVQIVDNTLVTASCDQGADQTFAWDGSGPIRHDGLCVAPKYGHGRNGDPLVLKACRAALDWTQAANNRVKSSAGCLEVWADEALRRDGVTVKLWSCSPSTNQQWIVSGPSGGANSDGGSPDDSGSGDSGDSDGDSGSGEDATTGGGVSFESKGAPGQCVQVKNGALVTAACDQGAEQSFAWDGSGPIRHDGLCIAPKYGHGRNGDPLVLKACRAALDWTQAANNHVKSSAGCLEVWADEALRRDGVTVKLWSCSPGTNQEWTVAGSSGGTGSGSGGGSGSGSSGGNSGSGGSQTHQGFFVSPSGSRGASGRAGQPWDLRTALSHPGAVEPGDTIWVRGGTYRGDFDSRLRGTSGSPIVLRALPGERATVDGRFEIHGSDAVYWGLEVMYSHGTRFSSQSGSWPTDIPRAKRSVAVRGPRNSLVNMVVHDLGGGATLQSNSRGTELYGSLIYNNGWQGPDRGHGHGAYVQEPASIADNIVFQNFGNGFSIFGKKVTAKGIELTGNVIFNSGAMSQDGGMDILAWGTSSGLRNITIRDNFVYRSGRGLALSLGNIFGVPENDAKVSGNHIVGQVWAEDWNDLVFRDNTVVGGDDYIFLLNSDGGPTSNYSLSRNTYHRKPGSNKPFLLIGSGYMDLAGWRGLGFGSGSRVVTGEPGGTQVIVRPNRWEQGRANVVVYSFGGAGSATVNLSGVLQSGQAYEVRHAQDFFGPPAASGTYRGGTVQVPLSGGRSARPIGGSVYAPPAIAPDFHVFVVVPMGR